MASCLTPFQKTIETTIITLPCGKCPICYAKRVSAWSFRLMEEDKNSSSSLFITLTYDTQHIRLTKNGFMNLDKRDVQLFMKRLRKTNPFPLKYYLCGEYGSKTYRPHYHIILFNADKNTIQKAWDKGQVHFGTVSEASVGYTLKYISKVSKIPLHQNDDRQKEFSLMSKRLGRSYITDKIIQWHKNDLTERMYCNLKDGKKITMPRYYKEKIYNKDERLEIKGYHTEKHRLEMENLIWSQEYEDNLKQFTESKKSEFKKLLFNQNKRTN